MKKVLVALLALVAIASLAGNVFLYQRYSTSRPVMRIGSDAITVKEYRDAMEYQAGKPVLTKLAIRKLVMRSAEKAGVMPTTKDVDNRIADIQRRQPNLLAAANGNATKMADLKRDLMADMALENLTVKDIKLTDAEVRAFYNQNKAQFQVPKQAQSVVIVAKNSVDAATAKELLAQPKLTIQRILQMQPTLGAVGVNINANQLPPAMRQRLSDVALNAPVGTVKTVPVGDNVHFVVRVDKRASAEIVPFAKVKAQAERMARLSRAEGGMPATLARLYKDADVAFEIPRYASYFSEYDTAAKQLSEVASAKPK